MIQRCTAALYRNPTVLSATVLAGAVLALRPCGLRISKGAAKTYNTAVQRNLKNARVHAPLRRFNLARGSSTFVWLGDASTVSVPRAPELLDCFYFAGEILGGPPHHGTTTTCTVQNIQQTHSCFVCCAVVRHCFRPGSILVVSAAFPNLCRPIDLLDQDEPRHLMRQCEAAKAHKS